ncbi:MAG TPA: ATP-dependent DNA helicase PcrA, partial [Acidimicrobiia bacterium]
LFVSHAWSRMLFGSASFNAPSRFLGEIPGDLIVKATRERPEPAAANGRAPAVALTVGDLVRHDRWGLGTVRNVNGSGDRAEAVVEFEQAGVKRLLLAWAPLERI